MDIVRKYRPMKISKDAITGVSTDKHKFMHRKALSFSERSAMK